MRYYLKANKQDFQVIMKPKLPAPLGSAMFSIIMPIPALPVIRGWSSPGEMKDSVQERLSESYKLSYFK